MTVPKHPLIVHFWYFESNLETFKKIILENYQDFLEGKIHFEHFLSISFGPSQG